MDVVKIGLLGGTFDPIHNGHLHLAQAAYETLTLKAVLFIPAGDPPHKQHTQITPVHHRLKMLELATENQDHFVISRVDLDRPGPHFTIDTVSLIRQQYQLSSDQCYFIIGSDSLVDLPTWYEPEILIKRCRLAIIHRPNYNPNLTHLSDNISNLSERLSWVETTELDISSTQIRQYIRHGEAIKDSVPLPVQDYISRHQLYK
ncbi:MAG: nicotinate-nucleotide adenylyltransferase [Chloroflexota bacterium]